MCLQDQEEPVYLERTARAHAEGETQVGPVGSVPPPLLSPLFSPGTLWAACGGRGEEQAGDSPEILSVGRV